MNELEERVREELELGDVECAGLTPDYARRAARLAVAAVLDALSSGPLHDRMVEAVKAAHRAHVVVMHPDAHECAICGDIGYPENHNIRVALTAALAVARSERGENE